MTTQELIARDTAHLIHPLHNTQAHQSARIWVKGEGASLTDSDGSEFIDGLAGLWNVLAGHGRRELAEADGFGLSLVSTPWRARTDSAAAPHEIISIIRLDLTEQHYVNIRL